MNDSPHDHDRPGIAEQRAALAAARAMLTTAELGAAHQAAEAAMASGAGPDPARPCAACATVAAASFGIAVAEQLAAGLARKLLDTGLIRAAILDTIAATERDLRSMGN